MCFISWCLKITKLARSMVTGRGWLMHYKDGLSYTASFKTSPFLPSYNLPFCFFATNSLSGIFCLTWRALRFDCFCSCFDAATFHQLREIKAIKLFQMCRNWHGGLSEWFGQELLVCPHAQLSIISATGWCSTENSHVLCTNLEAL